MPDDKPTHMTLDGATHKIALIEESGDGPGHTHRVHLGCGMTIDVDIGGVRAHARSMERLGHVEKERNAQLKAMHVELHTRKAQEALANGETWKASRWLTGAKVSGCADCQLHEAGAPAKIITCNHTMPTTRLADIDSGVACPHCGSRVYKRRKPGPQEQPFACAGQGHEFTGQELMENIRLAVNNLTTLVKE